MIDPADYADLLAALRHDLQLDLATDALPNTFPIVSGLMLGRWVAPTLLNAWANLGLGTTPAGYFKDPLGFVHLRGRVAGGASGSAAFNLPAGFRPGGNDTYAAGGFAGGGSAPGTVNIVSGGDVAIFYAAGTTDVGLGGITFLAEN